MLILYYLLASFSKPAFMQHLHIVSNSACLHPSNPSMMPCAAPHWPGWVAAAAVGRTAASLPMTSQKLCRHYHAWATRPLWALEPQACDWYYTDIVPQLTRDAPYCQNALSDCSQQNQLPMKWFSYIKKKSKMFW